MSVRGKDYQIVVQPAHKFFGAVEVDAYGSRVQMADLEKTLLDCLDRPENAGDIPEVAAMVWHGKDRFDWSRLIDHAPRFKSQSLIQRLGFLIDHLSIPIDPTMRAALLAHVGKSTAYLGARSHWQTGGAYDSTWRIVNNIPRHALLAEIEVQ